MVGSETLNYCLKQDRFNNVLVFGRSSTNVTHPKLNGIELKSFFDISLFEKEFSKIDICFYCLGVYQGQVSKEKFREITVDYLDALLTTLERVNPEITFCLFSAQGADPEEKKPFLFSKLKGRAEKRLLNSTIQKNIFFDPDLSTLEKSHRNSCGRCGSLLPCTSCFPRRGLTPVIWQK